jgi:hypothetical protein
MNGFGSPNLLATLALALYPLFILGLFLKYRPGIAVLWSLVIAELLLPPLYQLPISPSWLDKWTIPALTVGLLSALWAPGQLRRARPFRGVEAIFLFGLLAYLMAFLTNRAPLKYGPRMVAAQTAQDLLGDSLRFFLDPWIAFFLGRAFFKTSRDLRDLYRILAVSFLAFSLLILFEVRMSPVLNQKIYGYATNFFALTIRWGGYRPVVFFKDGLPLAAYVVICVIATTAMARARMRVNGIPTTAICLYSFLVLVLCKSTGAIGYGLLIAPIVYFLPPRTAYRFAAAIGVFFLIYPVIRYSNIISMKDIAGLFTGLSADRAESLLYRFDMEDGMIKHASDHSHLLWGWGNWGRNLAYNPEDGTQISIPDGRVIITITAHGVVGFYSYFIPLVYAIVRAGKSIRRIRSKRDRILLSALALNCAVAVFDLIVNSYFAPLHMLLLGALYSLPSAIVAEEATAGEPMVDELEPLRVPVAAGRS